MIRLDFDFVRAIQRSTDYPVILGDTLEVTGEPERAHHMHVLCFKIQAHLLMKGSFHICGRLRACWKCMTSMCFNS